MFPASRFSASRFSSHLRLHGLCFLGRPALPCPESPQSRAVRHAAAAAARCSVQPDCRGGRALSAPPETPYFRPASAPTGPPRAGPAFPLRKTHAVHAVPRTAVAAARRRGRRPPRAIAEFAAAQPKMPAALCAPAAGGRRLPHALWGGGEARRTGTCPLSLSPPPPAFAPPPPPLPPPAHPHGYAAGHFAADSYMLDLQAVPASPPQACRRVVPGAAGETDRRSRGESKAHFQARGRLPEGGGAHSVPGQPAAPRAGRPPPLRARAGRQGACPDAHRDGAALQARFLIAAPRRPACRPVRPTLR